MKQVLQNLSNGSIELIDLPVPKTEKGSLIIETSKSLISAGTERMLLDFGKANIFKKAASQPEKVKMVIDKIHNDGILSAYEAVKSKLDQPITPGYSNVGRVLDGSDTQYKAGTRVVSNGVHAEIVRVPKNLVAQIPDNVSDESASFTVVGAIALQGIRLINPAIGENIVVIGLGLIGLMAVQILRSNGCKVIGIDFDQEKCDLAENFGAETINLSKGEDPVQFAKNITGGLGVDAVIITASSESNQIMHQAASMCRKRGRIVLIGVVGLDLRRDDFYEKEISFQVSCSYGPGRYDSEYEDRGKDYPYAYVRWTEQRNFQAILNLMSDGYLDVKSLITAKFNFNDVEKAYSKLSDKSSLGLILDYNQEKDKKNIKSKIELNKNASKVDDVKVSFVGAGNYASRVLIPSFRKTNVRLSTVVSSGGLSAVNVGKKYGFQNASTNFSDSLKESDILVIATQHNMHADQTIEALNNNINVFVEKPLGLNIQEIEKIESAYSKSNSILMVGYNRRFSPLTVKLKSLLSQKASPKTFIMTMNAGEIEPEHWVHDKKVGGGRIIGEACHYVDLMRFLAGSKIKSFDVNTMGVNPYTKIIDDKAIITLTFEDGSVGSIHYFANGGKSFPKERVEVFCDNAVLQIDNFMKLKSFGWKGFKHKALWQQDKGQDKCVEEFIDSVKRGIQSPIPPEEIFEIAKIVVEIDKKINA